MKSKLLANKILWLFLLIIVSVLYNDPVSAQLTQAWVQRHNGAMNSNDVSNAIAVDAAGNTYVTGISFENQSNGNITTIKYNNSGNQVWIDRYSVPGFEFENAGVAIAVQPLSLGGNIYVTGQVSTLAVLGDDQDIITIKYTQSGERKWIRTYSYLEEWGIDGGVEIAPDPFGNVFVVGYITGNGTLDDIATIKYDSAGSEEWVQTYTGASATDVPRGIAVDASGNAYIISSSFNFWGSATPDFTTIRYTQAGVEEWNVAYNGPGNNVDQPTDIAVDNLQNSYVTGYVVGSNGTIDFATIKQNNFGTRLWSAIYNGSANLADSAAAIGIDSDGNVYVTGRSVELHNSLLVEAITTIKYTSGGLVEWQRSFLGETNNGAAPAAMSVDAGGNVYVTGYSGTLENADRHIVIIKYDSFGNQKWIEYYNGPGTGIDMATGIALGSTGNLYLTGKSVGQNTNLDYVTIRYSQKATIVNGNATLTEKFRLFQNYPNPFNPVTKINYEISVSGLVTLKVYDISGKLLDKPVNEYKNAGNYTISFDGSSLSGGVYYYTLSSKDFTETKRMVLLK